VIGTLAKSPHFATSKVSGYEDYDAAWEKFLKDYKMARERAINLPTALDVAEIETLPEEEFLRLAASFYRA
jgi:hypothetical protein